MNQKIKLQKMGRLRRFTHNTLGWHSVKEVTGFDGISVSGRCIYCGLRCLQDSQGNWFPAEEMTDELKERLHHE